MRFRAHFFTFLAALCLFMTCGALAAGSTSWLFFGMVTALLAIWGNRERKNAQYAREREHRRLDAIEVARLMSEKAKE